MHVPCSSVSIRNSLFPRAAALCGAFIFCFNLNNSMAQINQSDAANWLAGASIAPAFVAPESKPAWERKRKEIRGQLWELLGKLPPRPKIPKIETLSREERDGYIVEKFQFDNEVGATVPGYLLLPAPTPDL